MNAKTTIRIALILMAGFACQAFAISYTYDKLNRLTSVVYDNGQSIDYVYDAAGNMLSVTASATVPTGCDGSSVNIDSRSYGSAETVTCTATVSITASASGNVTVNSGADVTYVAPLVRLLPGFQAVAGSTFQAGTNVGAKSASSTVKSLGGDSSGVVVRGSSSNRRGGNVHGSTRLTQAQLPAALQALLDAYDAVAEEVFSDAAGNNIVFVTETALSHVDRNGLNDIYLYEVGSERLSPLSVNSAGEAGNGPSTQPRIDGGGNYVVYTSQASDLIEGDDNGVSDIYIIDLVNNLTERVSLGENGKEVTQAAQNPAISSDRPQVLYDRQNSVGQRQVYSYEYQWPTLGTHPLSTGQNGLGVVVNNHHAGISPNGQYVAYYETSGSAPDVANCQIMLYDQITDEHHRQACPAEAIQDGQYQYIAVDNSGAVVNW